MRENVIQFLTDNNLDFEEILVPEGPFPPSDQFWISHHIIRCKNLFFRDNHGKNHFLVIFDYYKKLDIKKLSGLIGRGSLTLASGWRLEKYLSLTPGFLSVFGILNDEDHHVKVIIDENLLNTDNLSFLPNTSGGSFISLNGINLIRFIELNGNEYLTGPVI